MHAHGNLHERFADILRIGHGFEQVAADCIEKFDLAVVRRFDHMRSLESRVGRHRVMPQIGKASRGVGVDGKPAGKFIRLGAALTAALHAAVAADRHDAALFPAQHAARQGEIDDRFDIVDAEFMLGQAHAVHDHGGARLAV